MLIADRIESLRSAAAPRVTGRVSRVVGLTVEIEGLAASIGEVLTIESAGTKSGLPAEVVSLSERGPVAMVLSAMDGLRVGDRVLNTGRSLSVPVGEALRGRVLDGLGRPMDGGPPLAARTVPLTNQTPHPLKRPLVREPVHLGVRVLDSTTPLGRGQRVGILAGSGVGKSSLLSMIIRGTDADISVLALIGERGREVREFIDVDLGPEGLSKSVVIVATSDEPAPVRRNAAFLATRIAEYFRDGGLNVNLLMDSLTRVSMAQREIGLSVGEPPATRGYPPSVFSLMPKLLERAGTTENGSITGIYTVLVEGDDLNDPIGDTARSILDGHISLSRDLSAAGHFPSVDVLQSISRVASVVSTPEQRELARELRSLLAAYESAKDLIDLGAYVSGADPLLDRAVALKNSIDSFLTQGMEESVAPGEVWSELARLLGAAPVHSPGELVGAP